MKTKDEVFRRFQEFRAHVENPIREEYQGVEVI
jgi:hypothetical protein